jgi:hypothetical protein
VQRTQSYVNTIQLRICFSCKARCVHFRSSETSCTLFDGRNAAIVILSSIAGPFTGWILLAIRPSLPIIAFYLREELYGRKWVRRRCVRTGGNRNRPSTCRSFSVHNFIYSLLLNFGPPSCHHRFCSLRIATIGLKGPCSNSSSEKE